MTQTSASFTSDTLFVGVTRPPMRWGVTYSALIFNLIFSLELFLASRNLLALLVALPIHGACALLCSSDARFFDLLLLWARTRLVTLLGNGSYWKASSYSPLTVSIGRRCRQDPTVYTVVASRATGAR
jgi:type IV secretion system protein VirB3